MGIISGELHYERKDSSSSVGSGVFISEAALWTDWVHCGDMKAQETTQLLVLEADQFQAIISDHPTTHARTYAVEYVRCLNETIPSDLEDVKTLTEEEHDTIISLAFPDTWEDGISEHSSEDADEDDSQADRTSEGDPRSRLDSACVENRPIRQRMSHWIC